LQRSLVVSMQALVRMNLLTVWLLRQVKGVVRAQSAESTGTSRFQFRVAQAARQLFPHARVESEAITKDGDFSIDVAVFVEGHQIALECEGPQHFWLNRGDMPYPELDEHTVIRNELLLARGWAVCSLSCFEFDDCHDDGSFQAMLRIVLKREGILDLLLPSQAMSQTGAAA
jgi:RAP domain